MQRGNIRMLLVLFIVYAVFAQEAVAGKRGYKIALGFPFPPWDVGPLQGVNHDLLTAICSTNSRMRCKIVDRPYSDCVDSDTEGKQIIGQALAKGKVDGCMGWFATAAREQLGGEFTHGYSLGPIPQLIASDDNDAFDGLGANGSLGGAAVGFLTGFFNDPSCLGVTYSEFNSALFDSDQAGRDSMVAALHTGGVDLVFWDSLETVPPGAKVVGAPVPGCGPDLATIVFPRSSKRRNRSDKLRRDFDCGLALIRENGVMADICGNSTHPGGDPACILDGPSPTVQCLAEE